MNEKLDLVEILKDCPKGTKFYSPVYGKIEFIGIDAIESKFNVDKIAIKWFKDENTAFLEYLRADGTFRGLGECVIFPSKDQRDWLKWHRPFIDGDIVFYDKFVSIFKKWGDETLFYSHISIEVNSGEIKDRCFGKFIRKESRFATEEEKQILFDAIKKNGYEWNPETKTLEKLEDIEDKGNISDGYHTFNELYEYRLLYNASMFNELAKQGLYDVHKSRKHSDGTIPFGDENWFIVQAELPTGQISNHYEMKDWELFNVPEKEKANTYDGHTPKDVSKRLRDFLTLEKLIEPKFKVGDRIRKKGDYICGIIKCIDIDNFYKVEYSSGGVSFVNVKYQNDYELVPNKFNPKSLQPFDKVLVKDSIGISWHIQFFEAIHEWDKNFPFKCVGGKGYSFCIPYNDDTKHLIGKSDEAPEFYRYWEE